MADAKATPSRILFVHSSDDLYGSDVLILEVIKRLDRSRYFPVVVLPEDMKHVGLLSRELQAASIEYYHLPILILRRRYLKPQGLFSLLRNAVVGSWSLRRLIREKDISLIHSTTSAVLAGPMAAWITRTRMVSHIQEIVTTPRFVGRMNHAIARHTATRIICVSDAVRDHLLIDEPRAVDIVRVVRNGIALPKPSQLSVGEMRRELGVTDQNPVVGMIGRISPWKGHEVLVRAAAAIRDQGIPCTFVAIGGVFDNEVHHRDHILGIITSLSLEDMFRIVDFRKDARELIAAFDVFVLPSTLPEPFGLVILEAMAAAKPVIATAHGGPREIVVDGETGLLVAPNDPDALAEAIEELLTKPDLARKFGEAGRQRLIEQFEMSQYIKGIEKVYAEVLQLV